MKVKAMRTMRNAYDQVLFTSGKVYEAYQRTNKYYILNELHTETPMIQRRFEESFAFVKEALNG